MKMKIFKSDVLKYAESCDNYDTLYQLLTGVPDAKAPQIFIDTVENECGKLFNLDNAQECGIMSNESKDENGSCPETQKKEESTMSETAPTSPTAAPADTAVMTTKEFADAQGISPVEANSVLSFLADKGVVGKGRVPKVEGKKGRRSSLWTIPNSITVDLTPVVAPAAQPDADPQPVTDVEPAAQ